MDDIVEILNFYFKDDYSAINIDSRIYLEGLLDYLNTEPKTIFNIF